ncbi:MAG TPA: pitrilysin family protein [Chitinophagaceae bacterium]|nr:pitrilysin family protein [Chitinophagaceae bacterium]
MLNRTNAPNIIDAVHLRPELPKYKKHVLRNGVEVYLLNMGTQDTLMINWVFYAGNWYEEKKMVAAAANHMLKNGTTKRTAFDINEHFEFYGAYLNRHCYNETSEIVLHGLSKHVQELLPVVAELVTESTFPEEELAIFKKNMQQRLQVNLKKNDFVANRMVEAYLFGESHPYGKYSHVQDYDMLDRSDLQAFFDKYYRHGKCMVVAAGVLPDNLAEQLDASFGALSLNGHALPEIAHPFQPATERKHRLSNQGAALQGSIRIATPFPNRHHPDFAKMQVLNNVLGGFFGSRLMDNIREEKGYTYGIHSYLLNHFRQSGLVISTEAGADVCEATIAEVYKEIQMLRDEPIDDDELLLTRNYLIGSILSDLDGPFQVAARWKNYILNGLTEEHFYKNVEVIKTVTGPELQEVAQRYLNIDTFYELVVI